MIEPTTVSHRSLVVRQSTVRQPHEFQKFILQLEHGVALEGVTLLFEPLGERCTSRGYLAPRGSRG
jgi:hypothetical protein